ncbi:MAG: hypothetical protein IJW40_09660 [Clostridia bacterium]|nr:hypothetical protein [Clostridia bacterium]
MKRICMIVIAAVLLLSSCTTEMPEDPVSQEQEETPTAPEPAEIDTSLYEYSVIEQQSEFMLNLPGMLLVTDQARGATLYYVNKASGEERIFCLDPLCEHTSCVSQYFYMPRNLVYHPYDGNLYGTTVQNGTGYGTELYCIEAMTQEVSLAWIGNGNDLTKYIYAYDQYILFTMERENGGYRLMRYDVESKTTEEIMPPEGRTFTKILYVSGDTILVSFTDDAGWYLADADFTEYTPTNVTSIVYLNGDLAIGNVRNDQSRVTGLCYQSVHEEEQHVILDGNTPILTLGFDGEYVYYSEYYQDSSGNYQQGKALYRVALADGSVEHLGDFPGILMEVSCFEGTIYYYYKTYVDLKPTFVYGKLSETESGFVAEDFEIIHP